MTGFLYNLQPEVTHDKDGKIHQRSNRKYENKNNTCYDSKKKIKSNQKSKIRIQKFMDVRVLMPKRTSTVSKNENFKISVSDDEFG